MFLPRKLKKYPLLRKKFSKYYKITNLNLTKLSNKINQINYRD